MLTSWIIDKISKNEDGNVTFIKQVDHKNEKILHFFGSPTLGFGNPF